MAPLDVIARYHEALGSGDLEGARALLRDDVRFTGPFESFEDADAYLAAVQKLWTIVASIDVRHVSADGDEVVALYDMVTETPAGTQLVCEWYGVDGDRIAWIRALFDTAPFAFLREGSSPPG
jgi:ketosteroid isomerase-like protein